MNDVVRAAAALRAGGLVAFPTETVYGLGGDASQAQAVARIFAAKGRPADHPVIVHLPDASHLDRWATDIPDAAHRLAAAFWPGPLTLILRRAAGVLDAITGGQDTVGLRVPNHPLALAMLREFDGGVAAPSANRFGHVSPTTAAHVRDELGDAVAVVLDGGPCAVGIESTILDLTGPRPRILRPGMLDAAAISAVIGEIPLESAETKDAPRVSGSLESHYSPRTPMQLVAEAGITARARAAADAGQRVAVLAPTRVAVDPRITWRESSPEPARYAHELYARLRELDALGADLLLVAQPPATEDWVAIRDRLRRAAGALK